MQSGQMQCFAMSCSAARRAIHAFKGRHNTGEQRNTHTHTSIHPMPSLAHKLKRVVFTLVTKLPVVGCVEGISLVLSTRTTFYFPCTSSQARHKGLMPKHVNPLCKNDYSTTVLLRLTT